MEDCQPNESISRRRRTVPVVRSTRGTRKPPRASGRPDFLPTSKQKRSPPLTANPGGNQSPNHLRVGANNDGVTPSSLSDAFSRKSKFRRTQVEITMELPLFCRTGSHKSRRHRLNSKKQTIQHERGVRVLEPKHPRFDRVQDDKSLSKLAAIDVPIAILDRGEVATPSLFKDRGFSESTTNALSSSGNAKGRRGDLKHFQTTPPLPLHTPRTACDLNPLISCYHQPQQKFRSGRISITAKSFSHPSAVSHQITATPTLSPPLTHDSHDSISDIENLPQKQHQQSTLSTGCFSDMAENQIKTGCSTYASTSSTSDSFEGPSTISKSPFSTPFRAEVDGEIIRIPRQTYDKPRRILILPASSVMLNISMHGFIDEADIFPLRRGHVVRSPNPARELVDDACLVTVLDRPVAVLGHACENQQISLVGLSGNDIGTCIALNRPRLPDKRNGVSAVTAMMQPLMFASGGHDHVVHLWELKADLSSASPRPLAIKHTSVIQSLLSIRDTSHKLVSTGADCNVHFWDLSSERVVNTVKTSNSVYHVHKASSPFCTLLEVSHRELQFEVHDHRSVLTNPVQRFGYHTPQLHGRFMKGDTISELFACGDWDGNIRFWDLRNTNRPCSLVSCFPKQKIVQVSFCQYGLLACSKDNHVALITHE